MAPFFFALHGTQPTYTHLRVFGCCCYPNLSSTTAHKLAPPSSLCVFLRYSAEHKGYRCLDLSSHRVLISRHVTFDESSFPFPEQSTAPLLRLMTMPFWMSTRSWPPLLTILQVTPVPPVCHTRPLTRPPHQPVLMWPLVTTARHVRPMSLHPPRTRGPRGELVAPIRLGSLQASRLVRHVARPRLAAARPQPVLLRPRLVAARP
jgi:hypothetical protein